MVGLLVKILKLAALAACGVLVSIVLLQLYIGTRKTINFLYLGKKIASTRSTLADVTDKRSSHVGDVLNNMKAVKMYAWEEFFLERIVKVTNDNVR